MLWEKNCNSDWEKLLKFEAKCREFAKFLRSLEQFIWTGKGQYKVRKYIFFPYRLLPIAIFFREQKCPCFSFLLRFSPKVWLNPDMLYQFPLEFDLLSKKMSLNYFRYVLKNSTTTLVLQTYFSIWNVYEYVGIRKSISGNLHYNATDL